MKELENITIQTDVQPWIKAEQSASRLHSYGEAMSACIAAKSANSFNNRSSKEFTLFPSPKFNNGARVAAYEKAFEKAFNVTIGAHRAQHSA